MIGRILVVLAVAVVVEVAGTGGKVHWWWSSLEFS